jgi:hypothetical protein
MAGKKNISAPARNLLPAFPPEISRYKTTYTGYTGMQGKETCGAILKVDAAVTHFSLFLFVCHLSTEG